MDQARIRREGGAGHLVEDFKVYEAFYGPGGVMPLLVRMSSRYPLDSSHTFRAKTSDRRQQHHDYWDMRSKVTVLNQK